MKIRTSELTGAALDWAVAKCEGIDFTEGGVFKEINNFIARRSVAGKANWSTNWAQGGPIIEREGITITQYDDYPNWSATLYATDDNEHKAATGPTPLIAAMRCYVASKLGDEVAVPKELL